MSVFVGASKSYHLIESLPLELIDMQPFFLVITNHHQDEVDNQSRNFLV